MYLNDIEYEIFMEGFNSKTMMLNYCPYQSGTLGYVLWWKGFNYNVS